MKIQQEAGRVFKRVCLCAAVRAFVCARVLHLKVFCDGADAAVNWKLCPGSVPNCVRISHSICHCTIAQRTRSPLHTKHRKE